MHIIVDNHRYFLMANITCAMLGVHVAFNDENHKWQVAITHLFFVLGGGGGGGGGGEEGVWLHLIKCIRSFLPFTL